MSFEKGLILFGGTFDPIHQGHLKIAKDVIAKFNHDVVFLPCHLPVFKKFSQNIKHRLNMLKLALTNEKRMHIDTIELQRNSPSYTIETLDIYRKKYPVASICFIIGMDAFNQLPKWYKYENILQFCNLILIKRPSDKIIDSSMRQILLNHQIKNSETLLNVRNGKIFVFDEINIPISSSKIRNLIKNQQDLADMLPPNILTYIKKFNLYV